MEILIKRSTREGKLITSNNWQSDKIKYIRLNGILVEYPVKCKPRFLVLFFVLATMDERITKVTSMPWIVADLVTPSRIQHVPSPKLRQE